jgi:hypothetical protein
MVAHECTMYPDDQTWEVIYDAMDEERAPPWPEMTLHLQPQDTTLAGWRLLLELVDEAVHDRRTVFAPKKELGPELWSQVLTLPASIAGLKHVEKLDLYGSNLLRLPPEIGEMESLTHFVPYTSYGLHWFPYEITRCKALRSSTVSTRALYGNYKYRQPFPSLAQVVAELVPKRCGVCDGPIDPESAEQVWISLGVAADVLPLLVNACSIGCVENLPPAAQGYVQGPHKGGLSVRQPVPD